MRFERGNESSAMTIRRFCATLRRFTRHLGAGLLLATLIGATAGTPAMAQTSTDVSVKQMFGYWSHVCEPPPPGAKGEICVIEQILRKSNDDRYDLNIQLKILPSGIWAMRIIAPHFVWLPGGVSLIIDGENLGNVPFFRCVLRRPRCLAQVAIDEKIQAKLASGKTALFRIFLTQEQGTDFEVSLAGLAKGMAALK